MPSIDFEAIANHVPLTIFEALATSLGEPVTVYLNAVTTPIMVCPGEQLPGPPCPMPPMPPCPPVEPAPPEPCPPWPPCPWPPMVKGVDVYPPGRPPMMCCPTTVISGELTQVGADFLALAVPIGSPEPAEVLIPYPSVGAVIRGTPVCPEPMPGPMKKYGRESVG